MEHSHREPAPALQGGGRVSPEGSRPTRWCRPRAGRGSCFRHQEGASRRRRRLGASEQPGVRTPRCHHPKDRGLQEAFAGSFSVMTGRG